MAFRNVNLTGFGQTYGSGSATINHTDDGESGTNTTSHTYSNIALGSAFTGRYMLVGVTIRLNSLANVSSNVTVTLGGTSMTRHVINTNEPDTSAIIYGLKVTSGTTADLVIDADTATINRSGFVAAAVTGLTDVDSPNVFSTDTSSATAAASFGSLSTTPGGVIFAYGMSMLGTDPVSYTWAGGVTEVYDGPMELPSRHTAAIAEVADITGTISATPAVEPSEQHFSAICLR